MSNLNPDDLTFPIEGEKSISNLTPDQIKQNEEDKKKLQQQEELRKKREAARFLYLPNDPIYKPISDELLDINEIPRTVNLSTKIMLNAALSDYVLFRKSVVEDNKEPEVIKVHFKMVNYDEFPRFQEVQEELNYLNAKIEILQNAQTATLEQQDQIRSIQRQIKKTIDDKIKVGLEVFFKDGKKILDQKAVINYNDLLFNVEIGHFRYIRSPFLRQP